MCETTINLFCRLVRRDSVNGYAYVFDDVSSPLLYVFDRLLLPVVSYFAKLIPVDPFNGSIIFAIYGFFELDFYNSMIAPKIIEGVSLFDLYDLVDDC